MAMHGFCREAPYAGRHFLRHRNNYNPLIRGSDWARGRIRHDRGEKSEVEAWKIQDLQRHLSIELTNPVNYGLEDFGI